MPSSPSPPARPKARIRIRRIRRAALRLFAKVFAGVLIVTFLQVAFVRHTDPPFTVRMALEWAEYRLAGRGWRRPVCIWRPLSTISPHLQRAVLAGEDQRFLRHNGFDFIELKKALKGLSASGIRRGRGASTITMQVARTVYLLPTRSITRKLGEAYYTILIELLWSKERILEVYLNTVDWGGGVMGAEAAARKHFGASADHIGRTEAAAMAAILPSPHTASPTNPDRRIRARMDRIIHAMDRMPLLSTQAPPR